MNKTDVKRTLKETDRFANERKALILWDESTADQHIEFGIAEVNLVGLVSELGATRSRYGQPLLLVGTS